MFPPLALTGTGLRRYRATPLSGVVSGVISGVREEQAVTSVSVGEARTQEFPALTRTMFVKYAGASGDFNPMHHDDTIATQVGNPSVFGHGMLSMGLAARVVKDWFGPEALRRLQVRFAKQVWPGDVLTCTATVTGTREDGGEQLADLDLTVENQNGDKAITGVAPVAVS
jgi:acyl dehydratase